MGSQFPDWIIGMMSQMKRMSGAKAACGRGVHCQRREEI